MFWTLADRVWVLIDGKNNFHVAKKQIKQFSSMLPEFDFKQSTSIIVILENAPTYR
jgi:hypothetical protein